MEQNTAQQRPVSFQINWVMDHFILDVRQSSGQHHYTIPSPGLTFSSGPCGSSPDVVLCISWHQSFSLVAVFTHQIPTPRHSQKILPKGSTSGVLPSFSKILIPEVLQTPRNCHLQMQLSEDLRSPLPYITALQRESKPRASVEVGPSFLDLPIT